jgi:hypothetical protein
MKTLSLKLDEKIFDDTEAITHQLGMARNRYINDALLLFNKYNERKLIKTQLALEIKLTKQRAIDIIKEWEQTDIETDAKWNP